MAVIHQQRATGREDVAAPIGVGAIDQAHDETFARLLREHRCVVRATGPAANVLHDGDGERSCDAKDDRIEDTAIDPRDNPPAAGTRAPSEEVRGESSRDDAERADGWC